MSVISSLKSSGRFEFAALIAGLLLTLSLVGTVWFYHGLKAAEMVAVERHIENLSSYVRLDILGSVNEQTLAQQRMAVRLARDGVEDEHAWRGDALLFQSHYPFYRSLAVLDADLHTRWLESTGIVPARQGRPYPIDARYRSALAGAADGDLVVTRPQRLTDGKFALDFIKPIIAEGEPVGYLAASLSVPDAIGAMVSDVFRDKLKLRVTFGDQIIYPYPFGDSVQYQWLQGFMLDVDGEVDSLSFDFAISESSRRQLESVLPPVALWGGGAMSLLLAIVAFLGLNATYQTRVLVTSNRNLEREIRERELAEQELEYLVTHDPLTGLPNRTGSTRYLERMLEDHDADGGQFALLFLDLDQFKDINDSLGHHLGDQLLCEIPRRLAGALKDRDFVGRHGGDEFLIAVTRNDHEQIEQLAANILRAFDTGFAIKDHRFFISASMGISYYPESGRTVSELIQHADAALFKAKSSGRNQFAVFTREMFSQAQHRLNLSRDIRHALDAGQFRVVYQPIVSSADLSLRGLEVLLRWEHEDGYMVPPQEFIRVAEETGVIGRLGEFAMEQALSDLAHWKKLTSAPPWLAVNISGAQVRENGFAEKLSVLLHQYRIEPALLHLEITEEILIENLTRNRRMLKKIDEIGMRIVVDDFGVGYSSLAYLKNFPISVVKIDRGFVQDLAVDHEDQAITRTICSLSADLGMLTVAEGVESRQQLELLRQFKCSYAQGFLFSRPVDASAVEAMLNERPSWQNEEPAGMST